MSKFFSGLKNKLGSHGSRGPLPPFPSTTNQMTSDDAPPAYSPTPIPATKPSNPIVVSGRTSTTTQDDDPYAFLSTFDTIFLIDDSGSMAGSRWREARDAIAAITPVCTSHDADGIDIYFLNHLDSPYYHNVKTPAVVHEIFTSVAPGGATPTGQRLDALLRPYLKRYQQSQSGPRPVKPINIICITDGEPSDDVESPLVYAARKLDQLEAPSHQVGVQFFQVGADKKAAQHLEMLDNELRAINPGTELRDIVDTVPFRSLHGPQLSGDGILKVVLGAVNRRLDRQTIAGPHA